MGSIVVVSGPSGSGKTSLARALCQRHDHLTFSVSTTTRAIREGERDGADYHFISKDEFLKRIEHGDFLEWAEVHGNFYGTSFTPINAALQEGNTVVLDIDIQGHRSIKERYSGKVTSVFVTTQTLSVLKERLGGRDTETSEAIEKRTINALGEMRHINEYDYLIVNDTFEESLFALDAIVRSARYRQSKFDLDRFFEQWIRH